MLPSLTVDELAVLDDILTSVNDVVQGADECRADHCGYEDVLLAHREDLNRLRRRVNEVYLAKVRE
jgi:hypothetical protein